MGRVFGGSTVGGRRESSTPAAWNINGFAGRLRLRLLRRLPAIKSGKEAGGGGGGGVIGDVERLCRVFAGWRAGGAGAGGRTSVCV